MSYYMHKIQIARNFFKKVFKGGLGVAAHCAARHEWQLGGESGPVQGGVKGGFRSMQS